MFTLTVCLIFWIIFGAICMSMAQTRGRNVVLAFFAGVLFGFLAVLYYAIAGYTIEERVKREEAVRDSLRSA